MYSIGVHMGLIDIKIDDLDHNLTVHDLIRMYPGFRLYIPSNKKKFEDFKEMEMTLTRMQVPTKERNNRMALEFDVSISTLTKWRKLYTKEMG